MAFSVAAIIVAAGRGTRYGGEKPKQYQCIAGRPVIRVAMESFLGHPGVTAVQPVVHAGDAGLYAGATNGLHAEPPAIGGATRQASVFAGLQAVAPRRPDLVLVHDAARPFASPALIDRAITAGQASGAAIPVLPVSDTVKTVDEHSRVMTTLDRTRLRTVQTPQAFSFERLLDAHRRAAEAGRDDFTDDAALAEWAGMSVTTFPGEAGNIKLTTPEDFAAAERQHATSLADVRHGMGFDVHAFGDGDHVMLGGVRIAHARGLTGHSDADVVLHAIVDAILGALSDGDIGAHFPPSDPRWRGASSDQFLAFAVERLAARGGIIAHLDVTLVCESPKIGPHRDAIRARIAEIAGIAIDRVAVKATTSEGLGFTGRGEGIAAFANATIRLPWS